MQLLKSAVPPAELSTDLEAEAAAESSLHQLVVYQRGSSHCRRSRRILGILDFSIFGKMYFLVFPMGFEVWESLQWIGNGCGLQMDGFSAHFEPYGSNLDDLHDFDDFAIVSDGLTLVSEGPRTIRNRPEGPGTL